MNELGPAGPSGEGRRTLSPVNSDSDMSRRVADVSCSTIDKSRLAHSGQCTHRRVGVNRRLTRGAGHRSKVNSGQRTPLDLDGLETHFLTRPICPDCPEALDQFDIGSPVSSSFTRYPIAREAFQFCAPWTLFLSGGHSAFPDQRKVVFWGRFQHTENRLPCPS